MNIIVTQKDTTTPTVIKASIQVEFKCDCDTDLWFNVNHYQQKCRCGKTYTVRNLGIEVS